MTKRTEETACDAGRSVLAGAADGSLSLDEVAVTSLPQRSMPDPTLVRRVRRMDDPEILERVLAGLLNLA